MPTETDVCIIALGKFSGSGDTLSGNAFISSIDGDDRVSTFCKFTFPRVRRRVIVDLATRETPFSETVRFADLGAQIDSDNTPEIGRWRYAFNLPGDCLVPVCQFNENFTSTRHFINNQSRTVAIKYQFETLTNKEGNGKILVTDVFSNLDGNSAFIEYVIDIPVVGAWSEQMIDAVATLLAAELCPVVGRDIETRLAFTQEYYAKSIPDAQRVNQKGFNNSVRNIPNYLGGRSNVLTTVKGVPDLGTYIDAEGNRRDVF